jgi:hypothetical protein
LRQRQLRATWRLTQRILRGACALSFSANCQNFTIPRDPGLKRLRSSVPGLWARLASVQLLSFTTKQASISSTDQGSGKRSGIGDHNAYLVPGERPVLQQSGGDQPDAILYPRRPRQTAGSVAQLSRDAATETQEHKEQGSKNQCPSEPFYSLRA